MDNIPTPAIREKREQLNFTPTVEFCEDRVIVRVIAFSKWKGLFKRTFEISKEFPHKLIKISEKIIEPYNCLVRF